MAADGVAHDETNDDDLKKESGHGDVKQTEQQEVGGAEVEHQHEHIVQHGLRVATELLTY